MIWLVVAERLVVTGTAAFSIGTIDAGSHDGFSPGGHFGLRVLVSEAPAPNVVAIACKGAACDPPGYRRHDLALFFTMGFAVGK